MPAFVSNGQDWYHVSDAQQQAVKFGTTSVATIVTTRPKKRD